jgi:two-component system LytT family response regulator
MKVIIIEDEIPAAEKLSRYLVKYDASIQVLPILLRLKMQLAGFRKSRSPLT